MEKAQPQKTLKVNAPIYDGNYDDNSFQEVLLDQELLQVAGKSFEINSRDTNGGFNEIHHSKIILPIFSEWNLWIRESFQK